MNPPELQVPTRRRPLAAEAPPLRGPIRRESPFSPADRASSDRRGTQVFTPPPAPLVLRTPQFNRMLLAQRHSAPRQLRALEPGKHPTAARASNHAMNRPLSTSRRRDNRWRPGASKVKSHNPWLKWGGIRSSSCRTGILSKTATIHAHPATVRLSATRSDPTPQVTRTIREQPNEKTSARLAIRRPADQMDIGPKSTTRAPLFAGPSSRGSKTGTRHYARLPLGLREHLWPVSGPLGI